MFRRIFAAVLLAALLLPVGAQSRIGTWRYLATIYNRPVAPRTTLGNIPPESLYCISDTITNCAAFSVQSNAGGARFCAESTAVFSCSGYEQVFLAVKVLPVGGDTTNNVRLALMVSAVLTDTLTAAGSDTTSFAASAIAALDSVGVPPANPGYTSTSVGLVSGERIITIDPWRGRAGKTAEEFYATGQIVPVWQRASNGTRQDLPPNLQLRLRCIGFDNGTLSKKAKVTAWLIGVN